jgi:hypothetical protein
MPSFHTLRRLVLALMLVVTISALTVGVLSAEASAVSSTPPRIVAKPNNVMVNTKVTLTGAGFAARTKLAIEECSTRGWVVVAQHPCVSDNKISVVTDAHGRFTHKFKVELCPRSTTGSGPATEETCYIGSPHPQGVDTISLVGAARVTVTYP